VHVIGRPIGGSDMSASATTGPIVVAPHHFPDLRREEELAAELGLAVIAAADSAAFHEAVPDAQIVMMTPYATLTAADFTRMTRCRGVVRYGMGYDNIDVQAAAKAGVPVSIVPGTASEEVASHAVALGLALTRRVGLGNDAIAGGAWNGEIAYDTPRLTELQVGVIGMGRIGQIVARMFTALGSRVRAYDPVAKVTDAETATLDDIIENSDLISLHVPLNSDTKNLISSDVLDRVKPGAMIVNVSRGGLIDESALATALRSGRLGGAGLDVFSTEPLPAGHVLRGAPGLLLTPHIAWRSNRSLDALREGAVERARLALTGQPMPDVVS
jgi:D-3-phosphoglycerate dehydrogenase / 2-oxoglutarate reductase